MQTERETIVTFLIIGCNRMFPKLVARITLNRRLPFCILRVITVLFSRQGCVFVERIIVVNEKYIKKSLTIIKSIIFSLF